MCRYGRRRIQRSKQDREKKFLDLSRSRSCRNLGPWCAREVSLSTNASLLYRLVSGSGLACIYGFVLHSRGATDPTVVRPSLEAARGGVDRGFDGGVGFSGLASRSCFPFQISLCWSWCSRFGVKVSPLLRLVVIRGSMEVVIRLAWWFSRSVAASWRLGPRKQTQVSSGEFFGGESRTAVCSRFGSLYLVFVSDLLGCSHSLVLWRFWSHWFLCSRLPLLTPKVGSFMSLSIVLWFSKATAGVASFVSLLASVFRFRDFLRRRVASEIKPDFGVECAAGFGQLSSSMVVLVPSFIQMSRA
ncbi:hypothetical protein Bca101_086392 [Brassica carinata]